VNLSDEAPAADVRRGQLDYFDGGRSAAVNPRVGRRANRPGIPGLHLAALCLRSLTG
jgi:hypothetical protein